MSVLSNPLKELAGEGNNAAEVKDCTELFLGKRNMEQLAGFERLVNLEVLWLHDNKLTAISNLDANIRIKQLYAHNNRICTLKGSLQRLKFLTNLDLSHNQLRDLQKVLRTLQHFHFLTELNLQGNPCCEEPEYRLQLIHALPSLQVLDHHQVTAQERAKAAGVIGGDVATLTVAFGRRVPPDAGSTADGSRQGRSVLEQELAELAETIKEKQLRQTQAAQEALYASNPDAEYWAPVTSLPPPPGVLAAQQAWNAQSGSAAAAAAGGAGGHNSNDGRTKSSVWGAAGTGKAVVNTLYLSATGSTTNSGSSIYHTSSKQTPQCRQAPGAIASAAPGSSSYVAKDVLILSSCRRRPGLDNSLHKSSSNSSSSSSVAATAAAGYMAGTFSHHLAEQSWELHPTHLKL